MFLEKQVIKTLVPHIKQLLRLKPTKGDVGLEIELEGNSFPKPTGSLSSSQAKPLPSSDFWACVKDGSLRGQDNVEYVLSRPIKFDQVSSAVDELTVRLRDHGTKLDDSNRTSVHVHLNCQTFHLNRLASFSALYFTFEEILTEWCGEHRVGNLFCLRAKDAPLIASTVRNFLKRDGVQGISDHFHYAGFNAAALYKFGSIEIRTMRGPASYEDFDLIKAWVGTLQRLYELSEEYPDPREVINLFSAYGPQGFFDFILGEYASAVRQGCGLTEDRLRDCLYEGIRIGQNIAYCRDWSNFSPDVPVVDPFGRVKEAPPSANATATLIQTNNYYDFYNQCIGGHFVSQDIPVQASQPINPPTW